MAASLLCTVLYLSRLQVPFPAYDSKRRRVRLTRLPLFGLFPYLTAILFTWTLCLALTLADLLPADSAARTDRVDSMTALRRSPWFRVPLPVG